MAIAALIVRRVVVWECAEAVLRCVCVATRELYKSKSKSKPKSKSDQVGVAVGQGWTDLASDLAADFSCFGGRFQAAVAFPLEAT